MVNDNIFNMVSSLRSRCSAEDYEKILRQEGIPIIK